MKPQWLASCIGLLRTYVKRMNFDETKMVSSDSTVCGSLGLLIHRLIISENICIIDPSVIKNKKLCINWEEACILQNVIVT